MADKKTMRTGEECMELAELSSAAYQAFTKIALGTDRGESETVQALYFIAAGIEHLTSATYEIAAAFREVSEPDEEEAPDLGKVLFMDPPDEEPEAS